MREERGKMDEGIRVTRVTVVVEMTEHEQRQGILTVARQSARDYTSHRFGWTRPTVVEVNRVRDGFATLTLEEH
jgi:hypothetical protein